VEELHDWCCWSRWYATSNNPHQEDRLALFTELPRRSVLGNPLAGYREVIHPSTHNAPFTALGVSYASTTCRGVG
jgi:hypothetical protein